MIVKHTTCKKSKLWFICISPFLLVIHGYCDCGAVVAVGRPREAARPLPAPIPTCDAKCTAPASSGTPATSPPHHLLPSPSVRLALRAASGPPGPVSPFAWAWVSCVGCVCRSVLVTIRHTPHGADDREATRSGPPSPPYARLWQSLPHARPEGEDWQGGGRPPP